MSLIRYNRPLFPRRFSDIFDTFMDENVSSQKVNFQPKVSISEDQNGFSVHAEIPGVKKEDINVNLEENSLTISGEKKFDQEKNEKNFHLVESSFGSFSRTFYLPDNVDQGNIEAKFEDGILTLHIPKLEVKKVKNKIDIK